MHTSYYGSPVLKNDRNEYYCVRLSNSVPKGFETDAKIYDAIPDWNTTVGPYKEGRINKDVYRSRYLKQLETNKGRIINAFNTLRKIAANRNQKMVFLCYERPGAFCHRHIFAEWLGQKTGEEITELGYATLF